MNLATARSTNRSKEVGVKRVLGAKRKQLILQFLSEAIISCLLAVIVAIGMMELALPAFNNLAEKSLSFDWGSGRVLVGLTLLALLVGLVSGTYPAFFLSAFQPAKTLSGSKGSASRGTAFFRKTLIVLQFTVSLVLIAGTGLVYKQLDYVRHKKLGFDKESIVSVRIPSASTGFRFDALRNEALKHPNILQVSQTFNMPGFNSIRYRYHLPELTSEAGTEMPTYSVDYEFNNLFGIEFVAGRNFSREHTTDSLAYILNEQAVANLGWSSPEAAMGQMLVQEGGRTAPVIGVMKDFHFRSLHHPIGPLAMVMEPHRFNRAIFRLGPGDIPETFGYLETAYHTLVPDSPIDLQFFDESLESRYENEMRLGKVFSYFAGLAIFVACLGLFGLASFTAEQRTKEIGIRKTLGASVSGIVILLSGAFLKLVGIALVIAAPIIYILGDNWLSEFAYRIDIGIDLLLFSGVVAFAVALLTVSYNAIKAAMSNPVESLRYQ
jgi:putative ABC transport system permease protein